MPSRTRSAPPSSLLHRLGEEIRAACRQVANRAPAPSHQAAPLSHPIGEWLGSVRQPGGEFAALRHAPRSPDSLRAREQAEPRGDLTRTRVTRIKGNRGSLYDAVTRDRGL